MILIATHRYALIFYSICLTAVIGLCSSLAAGGPCGLAGCLNNDTNYVTNQGGAMGMPASMTLPPNTETRVASGIAGSYSANLWTYGVSGQVLLHNGGSSKTSFTMKVYIGDQALCQNTLACYQSISFNDVTLRAGDYRWIPFTRAISNANTADNYSFIVTVNPKAKIECESRMFYSTEHD
jgi:hypothetical protein